MEKDKGPEQIKLFLYGKRPQMQCAPGGTAKRKISQKENGFKPGFRPNGLAVEKYIQKEKKS
jgi:hypothetical protein